MRQAQRLCDSVVNLHRDKILPEGTLEEMRDQHAERDLEELFFQLISQHDERYAQLARASHATSSDARSPARLAQETMAQETSD